MILEDDLVGEGGDIATTPRSKPLTDLPAGASQLVGALLLLRPDANVDRADQDGRVAPCSALANQVVQRLLNHAALVVRQVQAAERHLDDRVAPHQPVPQRLAALELGRLGDGLNRDGLQAGAGEFLA